MTTQTTDLAAVVTRLENLERQNRRLKGTLLLGLVGTAVLLLASRVPPGRAEPKRGRTVPLLCG